jgi:hypothetical protein
MGAPTRVKFLTARWEHLVLLNYACPPTLLAPLARAEFDLGARVAGPPAALTEGSEAEFITEHYWGYTRQGDDSTLEYQVEHPPWQVWTARDSWFRGPAAALYGPDFGAVLSSPPRSAFVAVGSPVTVHRGRRL